jgi:hypothetical protein
MALKVLGGTGGVDSFKETLKVGETFNGYLVEISESGKLAGSFILTFLVNGETKAYGAIGNMKYMVKDGEFTLGQMTQITRLEDTKVKGMKATAFEIAQDDEKTTAVSEKAVTTYASIRSATRAANNTSGTSISSVGMGAKISAMKAN